MATSSLTVEALISGPPTDEVTPNDSDTALNSFICSHFRVFFKYAALDRLGEWLKKAEIVESWILVELGKNARLEQPLALDQLFTISNAKRAVDRYLEMESWGGEWDMTAAFIMFRFALSAARQHVDKMTKDPDILRSLAVADIGHMEMLQSIQKADVVPQAVLFDRIEAGKMTGVWKMEKGWKIKLQTAFELFHTQLATQLIALIQAESLISSFTYFLQCHPNPYRLISLPSPTEAADPSRTFPKLSKDEYDDEIKIFARYCVEGGHQRANKRFIEKERAYDGYHRR
jgi:hypothetical protein